MGVMQRLALVMILAVSLVACAAAPPVFRSDFDPNATLGSLTADQLTLFCREQATYVFNEIDPAAYQHAWCLASSVETALTPDACRTMLASCLSGPVAEPWVHDCSVVDAERVGTREDCVTATVTVTWPAWASRLDCSMAGDFEGIRHALEDSEPSTACEADPGI